MYPCNSLQNIQGCYCTFRSHANSDIYNMLLLARVGENLIQGSFNCYYKDCQKWENIVLMMWDTINKIDEELLVIYENILGNI